jgi:hypothetical protein
LRQFVSWRAVVRVASTVGLFVIGVPKYERTLERPGDRGHVIGRALIQLGRVRFEQGDLEAAMMVFRGAFTGGEDPVGLDAGQLLVWTAATLRRNRPAVAGCTPVRRRRQILA